VFAQKSKDQDLGLFYVCGLSLVPSMCLLFSSFCAKLHVHAVQIWTHEGRQRLGLWMCKGINFVQEWYKYTTLPITHPSHWWVSQDISVPGADNCLQLWADCNVVAVPRSSHHKFCCLSVLTMLYDFGILKYFCIKKPLMRELLKHPQHLNPDLWPSGFVKRIMR
jgi:hypothetical protein